MLFRSGKNDGIYSYKEYYETMFSLRNKSEYDKENAEFILWSNTSKVHKEDIDEKPWYVVLGHEETNDWDSNQLASSNNNGTDQNKKNIEVLSETEDVNGGIETKIRIAYLEAGETVRIKLNMKVEKEDKELWRVKNLSLFYRGAVLFSL